MTRSTPTSEPQPLQSHQVTILNDYNEQLVGLLEYCHGNDDLTTTATSTTTTFAGDEKSLIILCHGLLGNMNNLCYGELAIALCGHGSIFRFDFSGEGPLSQGNFEYGNYVKQVGELHSVITYWQGQGYTIRAIVGHSKGANIVLMYHSFYPPFVSSHGNDDSDSDDDNKNHEVSTSIPLVVAISGRFHLSQSPSNRFTERQQQLLREEGKFLWKKLSWFMRDGNGRGSGDGDDGSVKCRTVVRPCWVTQRSIDMRAHINMPQLLRKQVNHASSRTRYVVIHGTFDSVIPVEDATRIQECLGKERCQLVIVPDADHCYRSRFKNELKTILLNTLNEVLQSKL